MDTVSEARFTTSPRKMPVEINEQQLIKEFSILCVHGNGHSLTTVCSMLSINCHHMSNGGDLLGAVTGKILNLLALKELWGKIERYINT